MSKRNKKRTQKCEDFLKVAASGSEVGCVLELPKLADSLGLETKALADMLVVLAADGSVNEIEGGWCLTESGWTKGRQLLRAHRVYESYLAESTGMHAVEWHAVADRHEHLLDTETVDRMSNELKHPRFDPHGDVIPNRELAMQASEGELLCRTVKNGYYRIVHLEDEPSEPYQRNLKAGLAPGLCVDVTVLDGGRYLLRWAGLERFLEAGQAAGCRVRLCSGLDVGRPAGNLRTIEIGRTVTLTGISPAVRGLQRRRLLDLGFVPGSCVTKEGQAAWNGPMRYRLRGTCQALRPDLAEKIFTVESANYHA